MSLRGDERAVTAQVGAVLILGFLVIALSLYQATVVPQQNEQVEFRHSQAVQQDMVDLRNAIVRSASDGPGQSTTVRLGTRYPPRTLFVNPPPPVGRLSSGAGTSGARAAGNVTLANVSVVGSTETNDSLGGATNVSTTGIVYEPSYRQYRNAPTTVYENGVLYNEFDGGTTITLANQSLVDGRTITVVTVAGNTSLARTRAAAIDPRAVSAATRTVTITNDSTNNVTLTVPTALDPADWARLTSREPFVEEVRDAGGDRVTLVLSNRTTYDLRMARVGVGTGVRSVPASYLTATEAPASVPAGESGRVVVEVRDRFNNPVSGTELSAATNATGGLARVATNLSDEEGRVAYAFEPPGTGTYAVNLSFGDQTDATFDVDGGASFDPGAPENVQVIVDGTAAGGGSGGASRATTLIDTSFENGFDGWSENVSGRATIANDTTTGADVVGSGYQSVRLVGPDPLAFESPVVDGAGFGYFDVEYWVKEGASGSGPERNEPDNPPEDLVFEYLDGDGTWQEADRVEATGEDGAVYERRVLIDSSAAAHGGLQVRFRRIAASGGDDWYVDDVRVYGIGSDTTGGSGSATGVALVDGSGRAVGTDSASVEFVLTNTGTADATVTDVAVDSTTDAQADVVDGGSTTVTTNRTGRLGGRIEVGGSAETFDTDVTLPAGEETVVTIGRFRKDNPGNDPPRRMSGDDVTLTLYFADGTTREYTVTAS